MHRDRQEKDDARRTARPERQIHAANTYRNIVIRSLPFSQFEAAFVCKLPRSRSWTLWTTDIACGGLPSSVGKSRRCHSVVLASPPFDASRQACRATRTLSSSSQWLVVTAERTLLSWMWLGRSSHICIASKGLAYPHRSRPST